MSHSTCLVVQQCRSTQLTWPWTWGQWHQVSLGSCHPTPPASRNRPAIGLQPVEGELLLLNGWVFEGEIICKLVWDGRHHLCLAQGSYPSPPVLPECKFGHMSAPNKILPPMILCLYPPHSRILSGARTWSQLAISSLWRRCACRTCDSLWRIPGY